jgi:hypothetical protein
MQQRSAGDRYQNNSSSDHHKNGIATAHQSLC